MWRVKGSERLSGEHCTPHADLYGLDAVIDALSLHVTLNIYSTVRVQQRISQSIVLVIVIFIRRPTDGIMISAKILIKAESNTCSFHKSSKSAKHTTLALSFSM
jgi:hypothetical protein